MRHYFKIFFYLWVTFNFTGCTAYVGQVYESLLNNPKINLEPKSDGTGNSLESLNLSQNDTYTFYAVARKSSGDFIGTVAVSWNLVGDIGTLNVSSDKTSATINATKAGTATLQLLSDGEVIHSVQITVSELPNSVSSLNVSNITNNAFDIEVTTEYDLSDSSSATLYYCNNTKIPNCDPKSWYSLPMNKMTNRFTVSTPTFKFPDDPKDEINIIAEVSLNSGTTEHGETVELDGPAQIYRSIGVGSTTALATRSSSGTNEAIITDSSVTFDSAVGNNIGVGDAVVIESVASGGFDQIFFIRKRLSSTSYLLNDKDGNLLGSNYNVYDWSIFRAYTSVPDSDSQAENTGIPLALRNFDTSRDAVADNKAWHFAFYADAVWNLSGKHDIGEWTLSGNNFLRYFVPFLETEVGNTQRHSGRWDSSKATCSITATNNYQWCFLQRGTGRNAVRIEGFQFEINSGSYSSVYGVRFDDYFVSSDGYAYVHNNIFKGAGVGGSEGGVSHALGSGSENIRLYLFSNIAYNLEGTAFGVEGDQTIVSHNTSYNNNWNYYGTNGEGSATFYSNISHSSSVYEFRFGGFSTVSDYNTSADTTAPGANALHNLSLANTGFVNTTPGSENLCITIFSSAYISGPKMIEESDPFKIYYNASGIIRNPNDSIFPLGACFSTGS